MLMLKVEMKLVSFVESRVGSSDAERNQTPSDQVKAPRWTPVHGHDRLMLSEDVTHRKIDR